VGALTNILHNIFKDVGVLNNILGQIFKLWVIKPTFIKCCLKSLVQNTSLTRQFKVGLERTIVINEVVVAS